MKPYRKRKQINAFKNVVNEYMVVDALEKKLHGTDFHETRPFISDVAVQLKTKTDIKNGIIEGELRGISVSQNDQRKQNRLLHEVGLSTFVKLGNKNKDTSK